MKNAFQITSLGIGMGIIAMVSAGSLQAGNQFSVPLEKGIPKMVAPKQATNKKEPLPAKKSPGRVGNIFRNIH
ncbi:MAG: hypothetical protein K2Q22_05555 [Cytophagales bacterium]|nr:hypothetical protein [Cytophagales bacterium]